MCSGCHQQLSLWDIIWGGSHILMCWFMSYVLHKHSLNIFFSTEQWFVLECKWGFVFAPQWMKVVGGFHWSSLPCAWFSSHLCSRQGSEPADCISRFPWVCFRWQTCLISSFSCASNILPNLHHWNWEEIQVLCWSFGLGASGWKLCVY